MTNNKELDLKETEEMNALNEADNSVIENVDENVSEDVSEEVVVEDPFDTMENTSTPQKTSPKVEETDSAKKSIQEENSDVSSFVSEKSNYQEESKKGLDTMTNDFNTPQSVVSSTTVPNNTIPNTYDGIPSNTHVNYANAANNLYTSYGSLDKPLTTAGVFWFFVLIALPVIGCISLLAFAFGSSNKNRRSLSRAILVHQILALVLIASAFLLLYFFNQSFLRDILNGDVWQNFSLNLPFS